MKVLTRLKHICRIHGHLSVMIQASVGIWVHYGDHAMLNARMWTRTVHKYWFGIVDTNCKNWRIIENSVNGVKPRVKARPGVHKLVWNTRKFIICSYYRVVSWIEFIFYIDLLTPVSLRHRLIQLTDIVANFSKH